VDDQPLARDDRAKSLGEMSPVVDELIQRDLDEVYLLIDHLSGRSDRSIRMAELDDSAEAGKKVNLIDAVCRIRWPLVGDQAHASEQAATLFKARDQLNELAAPATGLTIAYTLLYIPGRRGKSELARRAYPNLVQPAKQFRRWIRWLLRVMLIGLVLTSLLSWDVAYGRLVLLRIEQLDTQRAEIATAFDAVEGMGAAVGHATPAHGAPSEAWQEDEPGLAARCDADRKAHPEIPRAEAAARLDRACAAADALATKRMAAEHCRVDGRRRSDRDGRTERAVVREPAGRPRQLRPADDVRVPRRAAVMLNVNQKIRTSRLSPRDRRMTPVQLVLGIVTGACIGLFLTPSGTVPAGAPLSGGGVALSASALSFLAGFGVEGVFKMLENLLVTVFGGQTQPPSPHSRP